MPVRAGDVFGPVMRKARGMLECPCCKGEKILRVATYEHDDETRELVEAMRVEQCTHCMGTGEIPADD